MFYLFFWIGSVDKFLNALHIFFYCPCAGRANTFGIGPKVFKNPSQNNHFHPQGRTLARYFGRPTHTTNIGSPLNSPRKCVNNFEGFGDSVLTNTFFFRPSFAKAKPGHNEESNCYPVFLMAPESALMVSKSSTCNSSDFVSPPAFKLLHSFKMDTCFS